MPAWSCRAWPVLVALAVLVGSPACSASRPRGQGGACHALTDCKPGLVCADARCTTDLAGLAGQGRPPPFTSVIDAGVALDASTPEDDAGGDGG